MFFIWLYRKGDYYRYLAEFKAGNGKKEAADQSMKAYEVQSLCLILFGWSLCVGAMILCIVKRRTKKEYGDPMYLIS